MEPQLIGVIIELFNIEQFRKLLFCLKLVREVFGCGYQRIAGVRWSADQWSRFYAQLLDKIYPTDPQTRSLRSKRLICFYALNMGEPEKTLKAASSYWASTMKLTTSFFQYFVRNNKKVFFPQTSSDGLFLFKETHFRLLTSLILSNKSSYLIFSAFNSSMQPTSFIFVSFHSNARHRWSLERDAPEKIITYRKLLLDLDKTLRSSTFKLSREIRIEPSHNSKSRIDIVTSGYKHTSSRWSCRYPRTKMQKAMRLCWNYFTHRDRLIEMH